MAKILKPLTEIQHQIRVVTWANQNNIILQATPNGGLRSLKSGAILAKMGMRRGWPDLCCPTPSNGYHSLFIEMKRDRKYSSSEIKTIHWQEQLYWLDYLASQGHKTDMAFGHKQAIEIIEKYFFPV